MAKKESYVRHTRVIRVDKPGTYEVTSDVPVKERVVRVKTPTPPPPVAERPKKKKGKSKRILGGILGAILAILIYRGCSNPEPEPSLFGESRSDTLDMASRSSVFGKCDCGHNPYRTNPASVSNPARGVRSSRKGRTCFGIYCVPSVSQLLGAFDRAMEYPDALTNMPATVGGIDKFEIVGAIAAKECGNNPDLVGPTEDAGFLQTIPQRVEDANNRRTDGKRYRWEDYKGEAGVPISMETYVIIANHYLPEELRDSPHAWINSERGDSWDSSPSDYSMCIMESIKILQKARRERGDFDNELAQSN